MFNLKKLFSSEKKEQAFLKDLFSAYVDPRSMNVAKEEIKEITYFLCMVREDQYFKEHISEIVDFAIKNNLGVDTFFGPILYLTYGIFEGELPKPVDKKKEILNILSNSSILKFTSILYGTHKCSISQLGNEERKSVTVLLPNFRAKILELVKLDFGEIREN